MHESHASVRRRGSRVALVTCAIIATCLSLAASAEPYAIVDLGEGVSPEDVNNLRAVVGSREFAPGTTTAFLYTPEDGSIRDLEGTIARAVNDSGLVAGDTSTGAFLFDGSTALDFPDASA